jgi:hypothetical protein
MNSAQRRKAKKLYQHTVTIKARMTENYYQHDKQVVRSRTWCRKNFRKGTWRYTERWDETVFYFSNEKDATYFALKCL